MLEAMRADRLIALLMIMQTRGKVTAAEIAEELEISTRTARRDLEALAMSGVPIYSQPGRGGGWRLIGGATTDLTGLSSPEARALFLALGHQGQDNPMLEAALRKLVVALPERFRDDAVAATSAIRVDPAGWGQIAPVADTPFLAELSEAVIGGYQIEMRYARPGSDPSNRVAHPLGLVTKRGVWYLVANTAKGIRTFRLSRVQSVSPLPDPVDRPKDFDLDATWQSIVTEVESHRGDVTVTVLADPGILRPLQYIFAKRHEIVGEHPDGRIELSIVEFAATPLAAQLAGFGAAVEIVDPPPDVAAEMRRLASELSQQWLEDG